MSLITTPDGGPITEAQNGLSFLGVPTPPPPSPTAPPTLGSAPTISSTPSPGQGIALDAAGKISASILTRTSRGVAVITWPGSVSLSTGTVVTHGLGFIPTGVIATMGTVGGGVTVLCAIQVLSIGLKTFTIYAQTLDGSTPVATSNIQAFWIATA